MLSLAAPVAPGRPIGAYKVLFVAKGCRTREEKGVWSRWGNLQEPGSA